MESYLSAGLKAVSKKKVQTIIRVCSTCQTPLIWTFAFTGAERYCINCGTTGGMLGFGDDESPTPDLLFKKRLVDNIWKSLYGSKGLVPHASQRTNCKKCTSDSGYHYLHLTKTQKRYDELAREYLVKLKGIFN